MKQPARSREQGQRLSRDELALASGVGRTAEVSSLATAASAMALGIVNAKERPAQEVHQPATDMRNGDGDVAEAAPAQAGEALAGAADHAVARELVALPDGSRQGEHANSADGLLDPSALTARIAEQIASSVSHVLDAAAGGGGTPQTLSRDIVEQAQHIAQEVHDQFAAHEPLAVLADLVPPTLALDTLGTDIIHGVDETLTKGGVMDLLHGASTIADPGKIIDGIVADLHGLTSPVNLAAIAAAPLDAIEVLPEAILGGATHGANPLADIFYDDGDSAVASLDSAISDVVAEVPKIGFLAQPLDVGEVLGGLTHGHNALQIL